MARTQASERRSRGAAKAPRPVQAAAPARLVPVMLPYPLGPYTYRVPEDMAVEPGSIVIVPLGPREILGVVWDAPEAASDGKPLDPKKVKNIAHAFDAPPLPAVQRRFVEWIAAYTLSAPGMVLRMALTTPGGLEEAPGVSMLRRAPSPPEGAAKMTPQRERALACLPPGRVLSAVALAREAGVSAGVVKSLQEAGFLETVTVRPSERRDYRLRRDESAPLSPEQRAAAAALTQAVARENFSVTLLDGVTGSGKTEVYFEAVAATLAKGRQVLILMPEIALSTQFVERFERRFGAAPALWHSDIKSSQRRRIWRSVAFGETTLVVGPRSALMLPFPDLGLIIVDEEHDAAFKQEEGVLYHARDMGVVRARLGDFPAILVSATPSLESVANVRAGRYAHVALTERHAGATMPKIDLVDLKRHTPERQHWLSPPVVEAVGETFARGEQSLLFLNRRGYAPLTLCRVCAHRMECPNCSAWLVEHRLTNRLQCHHCGYTAKIPKTCPSCDAPDSFAACGPGVERLAEEVAERWPEARVKILSSDMEGGTAALKRAIAEIEARAVDIVIGTQIVAKGHHFPNLTLVAVVDADLGLNGGELRAAERTFQLIQQVAGRAGRAELPGRVLIQTTRPEALVMQALAANERDRFVDLELEERRKAQMPPYARLAALIVAGPDKEEAERTARRLAREAPHHLGVMVYGPAPAPLSLLRGQHRFRLLLHAAREVPVQPVVEAWLARVQPRPGTSIKVDIDPQSFL
jgi:primosomal protein N' (replication factor Y)